MRKLPTKRKFITEEEQKQERENLLALSRLTLPTDKPLIIYARQSTKNQYIRNKESAAQQTKDLMALALEYGWSENNTILYIENKQRDGTVKNASATLRIDERPGLSAVTQRIEAGEAGAIMVRDVSRLFRHEDMIEPAVFADLCKRKGVIIVTLSHIFDFSKPEREDLKRFLAEAQEAADYIRKHIKGVMLKNRDRKARRGEYIGSAVPAGLMPDETGDNLMPLPEHAPVVNSLFKRYQQLEGNFSALRREVLGKPIFPDLPEGKYKHQIHLTKVPGGWTIKSWDGLRYLLTNVAYIGHIAYQGRIVKKNAHPAIVDEDDFWFAFHNLSDVDIEGMPIEHPKRVVRYTQSLNEPVNALLAGVRYNGQPVLASLGDRTTNVHRTPQAKYATYVISNPKLLNVDDTIASVNVAVLDGLFEQKLLEHLEQASKAPISEEEAKNNIQRQIEAANAHMLQQLEEVKASMGMGHEASIDEIMERARAKIAQVKHRIDVAGETMDDEDLQDNYKLLKKLRATLADLEKKKAEVEKIERELLSVQKDTKTVYDKWRKYSLEEKQKFIKLATQSIILDSIGSGWFILAINWQPYMQIQNSDIAIIWRSDNIGASRHWTGEEIASLRSLYSTASVEQLREAFPDRAYSAIARKAAKRGIKGSPARESDKTSLDMSLQDEAILKDISNLGSVRADQQKPALTIRSGATAFTPVAKHQVAWVQVLRLELPAFLQKFAGVGPLPEESTHESPIPNFSGRSTPSMA